MLKRMLVGLAAVGALFVLAGPALAETLVVQTLAGETITLTVALTDTVASVKAKIQEKDGIAPDKQQLVFRGVPLRDDKTLDDYAIRDNAKVYLVVLLSNG